MLARSSVARLAAQSAPLCAVPSGARNMATLRELELRLKSVRNIEKITKVRHIILLDRLALSTCPQSMKMIASTKLAKAQRAMQNGKQYGIANQEVFENAKPEETPKRKLFLAISSDKGLCGGVHSSVSKATRRAIAESPNSQIAIVGDKSKAQLSRALPKNLSITFNQIGRDVPTFADAAAVADLIVKSGIEYDVVQIVYNKFVSALSYEAATMQVPNEETFKETGLFLASFAHPSANLPTAGFKAYEMEEEATKDLSEFALANAIFAALTEAHACEQSSRCVTQSMRAHVGIP
jgi:F-type H+-transporting ATPase subunit gamma